MFFFKDYDDIDEAPYIENNVEVLKEEPNAKKNVIVTGFGPFDGLDRNPSWEAVKLLKDFVDEDKLNVNLILKEMQVNYTTVHKEVPELWREYDPLVSEI